MNRKISGPLLVSAILLFLLPWITAGCSGQTSSESPSGYDSKSLTPGEFASVFDWRLTELQRNAKWESYKGKTITWTGVLSDVTTQNNGISLLFGVTGGFSVSVHYAKSNSSTLAGFGKGELLTFKGSLTTVNLAANLVDVSPKGLPSRTLTKKWEIVQAFDCNPYVGDLVALLNNSLLIIGSSGGGIMSAFDVRTGKEAWRVTRPSGWTDSSFFAFTTDSAYFFDERGYNKGVQVRAVSLGNGDNKPLFTSATGGGWVQVGSTDFWSWFFATFPQIVNSPGFTVLFDSGLISWSGKPEVWPKYDGKRPVNWAAGRLVLSGYMVSDSISYFDGQNSTASWTWKLPVGSNQIVSAIVADTDAFYLVGKDGFDVLNTRIFVKAFAAAGPR